MAPLCTTAFPNYSWCGPNPTLQGITAGLDRGADLPGLLGTLHAWILSATSQPGGAAAAEPTAAGSGGDAARHRHTLLDIVGAQCAPLLVRAWLLHCALTHTPPDESLLRRYALLLPATPAGICGASGGASGGGDRGFSAAAFADEVCSRLGLPPLIEALKAPWGLAHAAPSSPPVVPAAPSDGPMPASSTVPGARAGPSQAAVCELVGRWCGHVVWAAGRRGALGCCPSSTAGGLPRLPSPVELPQLFQV